MAGAPYRLARDPCGTRLALWGTQVGEGSPSVPLSPVLAYLPPAATAARARSVTAPA